MTRRFMRSNINNEEESLNAANAKYYGSGLCNGHTGRAITRQTSQELLKVQCNGLSTSHRNSKLLSPSGSDVLPLPTSRRSTRRASASWCGSTRELAQLSPTDGDIDNIRRLDSSFDANDLSLDSPGITLRPKGQLWLPVALIGTTAEENGNSIRRRCEYSARDSENAKFCDFILDSLNKSRNNTSPKQFLPRSKGSDSSLNSNYSDQNESQCKRSRDCVLTRNTKIKNDEMNGRSRESSLESLKSAEDAPGSRTQGKKRSSSVGGNATSTQKRLRTVSTNSASSGVRKKKLSPEEKLLQDNKEYFKMEILSVKLRSSGSLINANQNKETVVVNGEIEKPIDKIIIKKIRAKGKRKKSRWRKASEKKASDSVGACAVPVEKEKSDVKINGVIRKKRLTELTQLCDEAESFMFGESTRQETEFAKQPITEEKFQDEPSVKKGSDVVKKEEDEENSGNRISEAADNEKKTRKKRRSHAEAFIHDNIDYYKFETPGSRLRYQGSFIDAKQEKSDSSHTQKDKKKARSCEESKDNVKLEIVTEPDAATEKKRNASQPSEEIEKLTFSFENVPSIEPWYDVYRRQDEGMENYYPLLSDPSDQPFLLPYEMPRGAFSRVPEMSDYYKKKRKRLAHLFNHPRKSPRCHASTLAILSSLKKRKRRSGTNISMSSVLSPEPAQSPEKTVRKQEEREQLESEDLLNFLRDDENEPFQDRELIFFEPLSDSESKACDKSDEESKRTWIRCRKTKPESHSDFAGDENNDAKLFSLEPSSFFQDFIIETRKKSGLNVSVISLIENFRHCKADDGEADIISEFGGSSADGTDSRRRKRKARKINKTGWDNKKSRRRTGNKVNETKVISDGVGIRPKRTKNRATLRDYGIDEDNIIVSPKRRLRNNDDEKRPMLRSRVDASERCASRNPEVDRGCGRPEGLPVERSPGAAAAAAAASPARKASRQRLNLRFRCTNGRYDIKKNRLGLTKRRKILDYAWTTKRR